jgi:hypothetical protein
MFDAKQKAESLSSMYDANYGVEPSAKYHPPEAPYVGDTQQWTDLALKHILTEAAKGGHKRVVFSPGEHSADMYDQRNPVASFVFRKAHPYEQGLGILYPYGKNKGLLGRSISSEKELSDLIGEEHASKLLNSNPFYDIKTGEIKHTLEEPDMYMGGQGMIKYYQRNVNAGALKLLQQHDPSIKPEDYDLPKDPKVEDGPDAYKGFGLPMTDKARKSILENGWEAFKDGGMVDAALALTRRFTKDGNGATMALKSKGK